MKKLLVFILGIVVVIIISEFRNPIYKGASLKALSLSKTEHLKAPYPVDKKCHGCIIDKCGLIKGSTDRDIKVLIIGSSTSLWFRYPSRLQTKFHNADTPVQFYLGSMEGDSIYSNEIQLNYLLKTCETKFDYVIFRVGSHMVSYMMKDSYPLDDRLFDTKKINYRYLRKKDEVTLVDLFSNFYEKKDKQYKVSLRNQKTIAKRKQLYEMDNVVAPKTVPDIFRPHLKKFQEKFNNQVERLLALAKRHGIKPIFITEAINKDIENSAWKSKAYYKFDGHIYNVKYIWKDFTSLLNDVIRKKSPQYTVLDVEKISNDLDDSYFTDIVHLSSKGEIYTSKYLYRELSKILLNKDL